MKWPRISGNTYNNGMEVSNEMATMSNSDIWLSVIILYKYYNSCVYVLCILFGKVHRWLIQKELESRPLAENIPFELWKKSGKSSV
jgi:hypothetical protein